MTSNIVNQVAFLRTSRDFPEDTKALNSELNKAYIDIANTVNDRTIGIYPINRPAVTGEAWFINKDRKQQTLRQVYTFTTTADINIGFKLSRISQISKNTYGSFTDGTSWYGLIYASSVAIAGQLSFYVTVNGASTTSDVIKIVSGAGAPTLTSGVIVLEWLSNI